MNPWLLILPLLASPPDASPAPEEEEKSSPASPAPRTGLAWKHPGDRDLASHPAVVAHLDFESSDWRRGWRGGQRRTLSRVERDDALGFEPHQGHALRVRVEKGGHYGVSLELPFRRLPGGEPTEIYFRYYLRLANDWDPARGGKLPGISGTYGRAGWGGRPSDGTNGWSARGQFGRHRDGKTGIGFYCYHADMKGKYGNSWFWERDGLGRLPTDRWVCVEQHVRLNHPDRADGVLRGWIDGRLAFEKRDVRFRRVEELKIEKIWINVYHGGKQPAETDDHLYLDGVVVAREYIGPRRPVEAGGSGKD